MDDFKRFVNSVIFVVILLVFGSVLFFGMFGFILVAFLQYMYKVRISLGLPVCVPAHEAPIENGSTIKGTH